MKYNIGDIVETDSGNQYLIEGISKNEYSLKKYMMVNEEGSLKKSPQKASFIDSCFWLAQEITADEFNKHELKRV